MKLLLFIIGLIVCLNINAQEKSLIWEIGSSDNSGSEFALSPDSFGLFVHHDFGWEDKFYLINHSTPKNDWPYILPGPKDKWGGTSPTAGRRSHVLNILFEINSNTSEMEGEWVFTLDLLEVNSKHLPLLKVIINGESRNYRIPDFNKKKKSSDYKISIAIPKKLIKTGGNEISLTVLDGSWIKFDGLKLEGPSGVNANKVQHVFIRNIQPAEYELKDNGSNIQPLLIDVEHISGNSALKVLLDGIEIFTENVESGRYVFEAPMPSTDTEKLSEFEVFVNENLIRKGKVLRAPKIISTPANYVDTKMGTAHSRWMIAPGPWMPFGMVKLSPDNQWYGWQSGYDPTFESIACFSHIHEWTVAGLGTMPANGKLETKAGRAYKSGNGYRSRIEINSEQAPIGYYSAKLLDYDILAEITSTTRCGFQRYTFPDSSKDSRVLMDLFIPGEYPYFLMDAFITKVDDYKIEGYSNHKSPFVWGRGVTQDYKIFFVIEFDQPIKDFKVWNLLGVKNKDQFRRRLPFDFGAAAYFNTEQNKVVQMRSGISFVSLENARENLQKEISTPFGWSFDAVRQQNVNVWDEFLSRIEIQTSNRMEKVRFYTNMYRSLSSRNIFSDINGEWTDALEQKQQLKNPENPMLACDAFWNTFWNLNPFWNLITPEWSSKWVKSQLEMYNANGWLAKGPAGLEYIPVMVAEHEIPMIVGAWQMGIRDFDAELAFKAMVKMQTTPAVSLGGGRAGNEDLEAYLKYKYIPSNKGRFSNTMEYSFDDWTVAQFAKSLGKESEFKTFSARGNYWKNAIDTTIGFARLKNAKGQWMKDFNPFKSGANKQYVEGNAWQLTFFVPQDIPSLSEMIGKEKFADRLNWGFEQSMFTRFNGLNDQYWDYSVVQGNQQSMHFSYLFNWVGKPWLTQKWTREILSRYYGNGWSNAYLGDEDQGQMSAWFVMSAIGLFQTDGGCSVEPVYEIGSPLFSKTEIDLGGQYGRGEKFVIEAINNSRLNKYVQSATLNGVELKDFKFPVSELLKGGKLQLIMGANPNFSWGIVSLEK